MKIFLTFMLVFCFGGVVIAQTEEQESNLKAAFIYNFTKYIDWESEQIGSEFVIGIIGSTNVSRSLNDIARYKTVGNKRINIRYYSRPEDISFCNILFISQNANTPLQTILRKVDKGMLTISEQPGFAKEGTAFNFVLQNEKLKFEANLKAISDAGLKASSQLLKLAIIVE